MRKMTLLPFLLFFRCEAPWENYLSNGDFHPPMIIDAGSNKATQGYLLFDEKIDKSSAVDLYHLDPSPEDDPNTGKKVEIDALAWNEKECLINPIKQFVAGERYVLRGKVKDTNGNSLSFIVDFYGPNANPAQVIINEFNPEGQKDGNNPETIELYVTKGGNMGGITVYKGVKELYDVLYVFPSFNVNDGDYILVHVRYDREQDGFLPPGRWSGETEAKEQIKLDGKKPRKASKNAYDHWAADFNGLSATTGVLSVNEKPQGRILDAVIYSVNFTEPGKNSRSWGLSKTMKMVDFIDAASEWKRIDSSALTLQPEDAIRSKDSTATRSLNRRWKNGVPIDTNSSSDWYIVPTSKSTFGERNEEKVYSP